MAITVGDILRVVVTYAWLDGNLNMNVFNALVGGSGGPYDEADIVDDALAWATAMFSEVVSSMSDQMDGSQVQVYVYDSIDDDWDEVGSDAWVSAPAHSDDQLPRGVAFLINARTDDPDVQGKKYLGGMTEAGVTAGLIIAATLIQMDGFADEWTLPFVGGTSGADWIPGVWSVKNSELAPLTGTFVIPAIPAYQRRRKRGVGV